MDLVRTWSAPKGARSAWERWTCLEKRSWSAQKGARPSSNDKPHITQPSSLPLYPTKQPKQPILSSTNLALFSKVSHHCHSSQLPASPPFLYNLVDLSHTDIPFYLDAPQEGKQRHYASLTRLAWSPPPARIYTAHGDRGGTQHVHGDRGGLPRQVTSRESAKSKKRRRHDQPACGQRQLR